MEKIDNYSPLAKEYLDGYYTGFYSHLDEAYMSPISSSIAKLDELNLLPKNDIEYITKVFNYLELELICDKDALPFDNEYCMIISSIINKTRKNKQFIEDNKLMEYVRETLNMQYGFERYISESDDFRSYIYDLSERLKYRVYDFKRFIDEILNYITAYAYNYDLDKELLRKISIIFMCNYKKVVDTLELNGFNMKNACLDKNYFETLISLIQKCSSLNDDKGKVIS